MVAPPANDRRFLRQDEDGWFIPQYATFSRLLYEAMKRGMRLRDVASHTGRSYGSIRVLAHNIKGGRAKRRTKYRVSVDG